MASSSTTRVETGREKQPPGRENMEPVYALAGLLVGFIVGLTGVGGGPLMTPLLIMVFGIAPATAVGTDLLYVSLTRATGVWVHAKRRGNVEWKLVGWMVAGSIPAAVIALLSLHSSASTAGR